MESVEVPRYVWCEEPIYREVCVPIHGCRTVPTWGTRETPVTIGAWDPCQCKEVEVTLWNRSEKWQTGVERVPAVLGYRTEKVLCGHRRVRKQDGWETIQRPVCDEEEVTVGWRTERRQVGWDVEPVPCPR